jgi:hypothetical protein
MIARKLRETPANPRKILIRTPVIFDSGRN